MKRLILILLALSIIFHTESFSYGLAVIPASQNPEVKKKILDTLEALESEKLKAHRPLCVDKTEALARLFRNNFDDRTLKESVNIIDRILKQKGIQVPYAVKLKLALVSRELFLRPHTKAQTLAEKFNLEKPDLITIFRFIREIKVLQDVVTRKSKYSYFIYEMMDVLRHRQYLTDIFDGKVVYPLIVEWHPGERCNSNCIFCFNRGMEYQDRTKGRRPLSLEKIKELIGEFKANGVREFWVSGGKEPLTNPVTVDAIKEAIDAGLEVKFYSNGILLNEKAREAVVGAKWVRISINAATPETYEKVQGIDGKLLRRVLSNLRALAKLKKERRARVSIGTSFLITPYSYKEIAKAAENAFEAGCDFFAVRADMIGTLRKFTEDEIQEILKEVDKVYENKKAGKYGNMKLNIRSVTHEDLTGEKPFLPDMDKAKTCRVRAFKIGMNPYGIVFPCEYAEHPRNAQGFLEVGDVTHARFYDIMEKSCKFKHDPALCEACTQHEFGMNVMLDKFKDDMDYGIPLEDQPYDLNGNGKDQYLKLASPKEAAPTRISAAGSFAKGDVIHATSLFANRLQALDNAQRRYEIKFDASRLSSSQIEVIRSYAKLLKARTHDEVVLRPFSSANGSKESLVAVYCLGDNFKGEGHVDISIQEGELKDYLLRITGMLNIAFASATIPQDLTIDELYKYKPVIDYIRDRYKSILGVELALPDALEDMLNVLRYIILKLPKSMRVNHAQIEEYNANARKTLAAA